MKRHIAWTLSGLLSVLVPGCVAEVGDPASAEDFAPAELPLADEIDGVAERVYFQYGIDPSVTLRSYAVATVESCSGTMIGPNVLLTAAHCRAERPKRITFRVYESATSQQTETYDCEYLVHGWPEHDLALFWCGPGPDGVNPGDRWGYVDLDVDVNGAGRVDWTASGARVTEGAPLYSIWWNRIDSLGADAHLYSEGEILNRYGAGWFNPGGDPCSQDDDMLLGVSSDVYGVPGASGSSQLSATTHRLALGPLSTVGSNRNSAALVDVLRWDLLTRDDSTGACAYRSNAQVNAALLERLWDQGIRFDPDRSASGRYYGRVDADGDGIFDVQHDLEASAGERARSFYFLGFESIRRNALWERGPRTSIVVQPRTGYAEASLDAPRGEWFRVLRHDGLHLDPSVSYRVRYRVNSTGAGQMVLCGQSSECRTHTLAAGDQVLLDTLHGAPSIDFIARGNTRIRMQDVSIVAVGATNGFDSHDERQMWSRTALGARGAPFIQPNGRMAGTRVDWAGVVRQGRSFPWRLPDDLVSEPLAPPTGQVRVCFAYRGNRVFSSSIAHLRLRGVGASEVRFAPTTRWLTTCSPWVDNDRTDAALQFGIDGYGSHEYRVDDVRVEWRPTRIVVGPIGGVVLAP